MDIKDKMRSKRLTEAKQNATETPLNATETPLRDRQADPSSGISGGQEWHFRGQEWHLSGISENETPLFLGHSDPSPDPQTAPDPAPIPATEDGITRAFMDSKVLGVVPISWTPDGATVWIDGIPYTEKEVNKLVRRQADADTLRTVHETKRAFGARLLERG